MQITNTQITNTLRLLFDDDPVNRETGALAASGLGLVEPLHRQLSNNLEKLRREFYKLSIEKKSIFVADDDYLDELNDIICNYRNAILQLSCFMPKTYESRQRQIATMVKNVTFKYMSMQCRETPKTTEIFINQLNGYRFVYGFLFI
jgi:hypothetical protein